MSGFWGETPPREAAAGQGRVEADSGFRRDLVPGQRLPSMTKATGVTQSAPISYFTSEPCSRSLT